MFLVYAVCYDRDEDDKTNTESVLHDAVVFCQKTEDTEQVSKDLENHLIEDSDDIKIFDLSKDSERDEAMGYLSSLTPFVRD